MSTLNTIRQLAYAKKVLTQALPELEVCGYKDEILPHLYLGRNGSLQNYAFTSALETIIKELENEILRIAEDLE